MESAPTVEESLAVARQAQRAAVERARSPWWYHPAHGVLLGAVCVGYLLAPGIPASIALILTVIGNRVLDTHRLRLTGARFSEFRNGAWVYTTAFGVALLATLGLGMFLVLQHDMSWVAWVVGVVVFSLTVAHGWLIEHASHTSFQP